MKEGKTKLQKMVLVQRNLRVGGAAEEGQKGFESQRTGGIEPIGPGRNRRRSYKFGDKGINGTPGPLEEDEPKMEDRTTPGNANGPHPDLKR